MTGLYMYYLQRTGKCDNMNLEHYDLTPFYRHFKMGL